MVTKKKELKRFDVNVQPQIEKMWLDQEYRDVLAENAEAAVEATLDRVRKDLVKGLRAVARRKSPNRLCIATFLVHEVVSETRYGKEAELDYNV